MTRSPHDWTCRIWLAALLALTVLGGAVTAPVTARGQGTPEAAACASAGGYLILQERSALGAARAGLVVVDPATGDETGRIAIPTVDTLFPTKLPGRALAIAGTRLFLIEADELRASEIALGKNATDLSPNPVQFRGSAGTRFLLLGSPSFDQVYLIDAESGTSTNLTALIDPPAPGAPVLIQNAAITPDDAHAVLWDGRHVYAVQTARPAEARRVDHGAFAFSPAFSPDGTELVVSESEGPGSGSTLVRESIDGTDRQVLRESEFAQVTLWVPDSRTILIDERTESGAAAGTVSMFDLDAKSATELTRYDGSLTTVQMSADGKHALLGMQQASEATWQLADFSTGTVRPLPQLGAGQALPGLYGHALWALIVPIDSSASPLGGPAIKRVDLATGAVGRLLDLTPEWPVARQPVLSPDGRYALVVGASQNKQKLWLLDAAELRATDLGEAKSMSALFSPDGCFVAVTTETPVDGLPVSATSVISVYPGSTQDLGNGAALAWLPAAEHAE